MGVFTFAEVIAPLQPQHFFLRYWGKKFLFQKGSASRFADLLPWTALNRILSEHRLEHPRLRLAKDGSTLPPSSILTYHQNRRGIQIPTLRTVELNKLLKDGATLVLDAVDEMYPPLRRLAMSLEKTFGEYVQVNAYAGWGLTKGFDLHWDDHDVVILQVAGRKAWEIYGVSRKYPMFRDKDLDFSPPSKPLWKGVLSAGAFLYMPRGFWHVATALAEPSLHLTFGINNRTGIDLVNWIADSLTDSELFRQDLPRFAPKRHQARHMRQLKRQLNALFAEDTLARFFRSRDESATPRPHLALPWSATKEVFPPSSDALIASTLPRTPIVKITTGAISLRAFDKEFHFAIEARPILDLILSRETTPLKEIVATTKQMPRKDVIRFLKQLFSEGLITVRE